MLTEAERAFPRRYARTGRFGNGAPRAFTVSPDGERVIFLRSSGPEDPANALWAFDVADAAERLVVAPAGLDVDVDAVSSAERSRRERVRESASGIVAYAADEDLTAATFTSGGSLFLVDLRSGAVRQLPAEPGVFDPRPDPTGARVAYVTGGALHVVDVGAGADRIVAADPDPDVLWGIAEFAAAEEMGRIRGFWWSPDGAKLAAARVDERPVRRWFVADPTDPEQEPRAVRYPVAGTANADVSLALLEVGNGSRVDVQWDREAFPYLARVGWPAAAPLTVLVQSRDQRRTQALEVDEATGRTHVVLEAADPSWVELVPGSPVRTADGRLVSTVDADDTRTLAIDGEPRTRPGLQIRSIVRAAPDVIVTASEDPRETHLYRVPLDGSDVERLTTTPGVHSAAAGGDTLVVVSRTLDRDLPSAEVRRAGAPVATIASLAEEPSLRTKPSFFVATERELRSALLVPEGTEPERTGPLPVLLDPYGGPHHARVVHARYDFHVSQWFADRGFAVLVTDGRGTPGRGCTWERAIAGDLAGPALQDQVDALHAAAERHPGVLDLDRVAIRGWSFGGFLAALAVLERPDVVHAAIAGAPVSDWRLYDTHYTERYLGMPDDDADAYDRSSILARAERLDRPLLLIHGLADDNVVVAHTLRLSEMLFEAGRDHELVLLPNATHMTRSEVAVERRFDLELAFLRRALDLPGV